MSTVPVPSLPAAARAACLRAVDLGPGGPQALVSLSAEQYLRIPLAVDDLPLWRARIGQRVWLQWADGPEGDAHV